LEVTQSEVGWVRTVVVWIVFAIAVFGMMGFAWLSIQDRMNGIDAWREVEKDKRSEGFRKLCEDNALVFERLKEHLRQQKINAPAEYLVTKPCVQPDRLPEPPKEK
jgi:hypothetical protein